MSEMRGLVVFLVCLVASVAAQSTYLMGDQGESCAQACFKAGLNCNPHIETSNSTAIFQQLGISCQGDSRAWWATDQPSYVADSRDPNFGKCLGYSGVPGGVVCLGAWESTRRLCRCDAPSKSLKTFGTGYSSGYINQEERWIFTHYVAPGDVGVMNHFWITYATATDKGVIIRYYIDGETTPSIELTPSLACGVGFYDPAAAWGTKWFGKGAKNGSWFFNFRIPFYKSIRVTAQHQFGTFGGFYMIVRGSTNLPIEIGGVRIPFENQAKLQLQVVQGSYKPVEYINLANVPKGPGLYFLHTLAVASGNENFLEGCYHMYTAGQEFPGTILSTGTEDYFDSGWYFDAGQLFHFPVAGYTHIDWSGGAVTWSAYRFHEMDPLVFDDGFRLVWRNGDSNDPAGVKCMMEQGGGIVGTPTISNITSYSWIYTWNP